ncbi:FKBP-type peptidyl-prolyl cis-trans isomerase [Candidatus Pacearchaeota archaeon]|nr:FKBP-type peptidyl-prolyl cis-trans isomerase [Candidatus Pacearchaeota archaeon]
MEEKQAEKPEKKEDAKQQKKQLDITNYVIIAVVIIAIIGFLIYNGTIPITGLAIFGNKVKIGDQVAINYVGKLENNSVFDTNIADVAKQENMFNPLRPYEPLSFVVGNGEMIKGVDNAVVGMKLGEKKEVVVKPADGYGFYDDNNVQTIPRVQRVNKTLELDRYTTLTQNEFNQIFGESPVTDKEYSVPNVPWKIKVNSIFGDIVSIENLLTPGKTIQLSDFPWESLVLGVTKDKIRILHNPKSGQKIQTSFGEATIRLKGSYIDLIIDAKEGDQLVKEVTEDTITIDTNHPLAGQTLYFDIEIVSVNKTK